MSERRPDRALAGAWVENSEETVALEVRGGAVPDEVADVDSAVARALLPFLVDTDENDVKSVVCVNIEHDGSEPLSETTAPIHVVLSVDDASDDEVRALSRVEILCDKDGFGLDGVVARSMAASIANAFGGDVSATALDSGSDDSARSAADRHDIVDRISAVANEDPHRVAIRNGAVKVTFEELVSSAQRRAAALTAAGAPGMVTVLYARSPEAVIEMLAVLISGRAYALLSPSDSADYNADVARWIGADSSSSADDMSQGSPARAAYVAFTSGTTGRPKAIVVERAQLSAYCMFLAEAEICGPEVVMPALSAPGFDAIVKQIWGQLGAGGEVRLPETDDVLFEIEQALQIDGVTINTVPTVWRELLDTLGDRTLPASGTLLLGGETLEPALVARTHAVWPGAVVINLYGPSECTSNATWFGDCSANRDATPIGEAVGGSHASVLGPDLAPVPDGAVGELYVSGDCVSRGYLGDPRSTAAAYLPDVNGFRAPGGRMYATGDLVRRTSDGLVHLGRADSQRKVNGVRVDTETLRRDLLSIDGVDEAAVTVEDGVLEVFVAPASRTDEVRAHTARHWRSEIGEARVHGVEKLPRTASGKLDAAALRKLHGEIHGNRPAPSSEAGVPHRVMQVIWGNVLGDSVPLTRSSALVDLGANSMKRLKLVALYRRILRVEVSLDDFADRHTLGEHEDFLIGRVDDAHLGELSRTLETAR